MSNADDVFKVQNVSKQLTKMTFFSTKLEWRTENYRKSRGFYKVGQLISSKAFILPNLSAVWQLDVYPGGKYSNGYTSIYLRLIGFKTPDGSLSEDKESAMADYKIYVLSGTNEKKMVIMSLSEFKIDLVGMGSSVSHGDVEKFIHPDASLLVICEVDCLASEEICSVELPPNSGLLYPNPQLNEHMEKLWKAQLFSDCTLQISAMLEYLYTGSVNSEVMVKVALTTKNDDMFKSYIEISAMLEYLYTGSVNDEVIDTLGLELLALADKYAVIPLKEMCEDYLASTLTTANFLQAVTLADRNSAAKLKQACVNRLVIDGPAALRLQDWENLKRYNKCLADELLELLIKVHTCFADMQKENTKDTN
ncbi:BTB and MATH domain-containing protein 42 [Ditylenchus destructor]|uniref:BTB and MATH domain-containing protein 42 n=1 Tax=Ditylenchus destructor TaxID=166010 RepID=A0AAD4MW00_9BILA|nr:BTB and MATH domain-containing protein 42 [Ditylenchus destructor]